jgi:hypothetical protein
MHAMAPSRSVALLRSTKIEHASEALRMHADTDAQDIVSILEVHEQ